MVHSRQQSSSFTAMSKSHSFPNHGNNLPMMCGSSPLAMFQADSGHGLVGSWPLTPGQNFNDYISSPQGVDYQRRWSSQQDQSVRYRDSSRRSECRGVHHSSHSMHAQNSSEVMSSTFVTPPELRSTTFQNSYPRPTSELIPPMSTWNHWDIESDAAAPLQPHIQRLNESSWSNPLNVQIPQFNSQQFDNMLFSASDTSSSALYTPGNDHAISLNGYSFPQRLSPIPSPSPSPVYHSLKHTSPTADSPKTSRRGSLDRTSDSGKSCSHCHATSTPLWRRDPSSMKPLCNACGLYLQQRNKLRPQELIDADDDGSTSDESDVNYVGPECSHCHTHHTSVWRRSKAGEQLCNACGVYARLRGKPRPLSLKRNKIRPRSKHLPK